MSALTLEESRQSAPVPEESLLPRNVQYDAVIIGSGFGGSINALRLSQAGKSVLVLERGRWYRPGEFPRRATDTNALFWRYPRKPKSRGLYDVRFFSGISAVVASGVGGGSLIYANVHIRPPASVFDDPRWPPSINRATLEPYFDRAARMIGVSPLPADVRLAKRDAFHQAGAALGREVFDPDEAVSWETPKAGGRGPCRMCAECEFGCQLGAKNTMDLTYLAEAERLGALVLANQHVSHIEPGPEGYRVHYQSTQTGEKAVAKGSRVIVSAGTLGTNELLLRSRDVTRTLPNLSRRLGWGYSGNGDFLGSIQNSSVDLQPWVGPDVTSVMVFPDDRYAFTMAAPTFNQAVMSVLASAGQPGGAWMRPFAPLLWPFMPWLIPFLFGGGFLSRPLRPRGPHAGDPARMTNLFAIGRDNANGRFSLKRDRLDLSWDYAKENRELVSRMEEAMNEVAREYGGTAASLFLWNVFQRITTVHSLGGCHLSDTPEAGVVSPEGEVHCYPGLYVADGSVIPTSIGYHPVMTICAVAERTAEAVIHSFSY